MTTLISWVGVDQRGAASLYLAADSRVTWPDGTRWDRARKLFAAQNQPHILGFCGDAFFPSQILGQIVELIDGGLFFPTDGTPTACFERLVEKVGEALRHYPESASGGFDLLHGVRSGKGLTGAFHLFGASFQARSAPRTESIPMTPSSELLSALGSGAPAFRASLRAWLRSDAGGTSRAVFSALGDAIRAGSDPRTGGPPQLVGLYRKGPAKVFGTVWEDRRWFLGTEVPGGGVLQNVGWHNDLFEIVDPVTRERATGAQPQPRPRNVG